MAKHSKSSAKSRDKQKTARKPTPAKKTRDTRSWWEKWSAFVLLGIMAIIFLQGRLQLLGIPLERDEGSFAYIGHWLLKGKELYTDMLDSKLPGLYTIYALSTTLFGYNATGVHTGLFMLSIAS